jgi:outer membrane protein TolC
MKRPIITALYCIFQFLGTQLSISQNVTNPDSTLHEFLKSLHGDPLTLQQAVAHALESSTSVRQAEASYLAAGGTRRKEAGFFDPLLFFNLNYLDQAQPEASFFAGASVLATQQTLSRTGLQLTLPIGTQLQLAVNSVSLNTNSSFAFLNPEYDAFGSLTLRQPLLAGFAASGRKNLTHSERELDAAKARYDQEVLTTSADVERAYWDLYASERDFGVQQLTRDRAAAFLKEAETRAATGLIGPNQVANAKSFLAEQDLALIDREELFDASSDQLASIIGVRPAEGQARFLPSDEPPGDFTIDSVDVLVNHVLKNNLDLKAAEQEIEAANTMAEAAGWELLPSVNFVGSLGGYGLAGTPQDVIFNSDTLRTSSGGSFGSSIQQVARRDFPTWSVGVEVSIPIGLRPGLGEQDRLEAEAVGARERYIETSRRVEERVRAAHRELVHGKKRLEAARRGVEAAQDQVRIGIIEFRNGRTTAFELVTLGEDFATAQRRYSEALVHTAKAAATLRELTSGEYTGTSTR